MPDIFNSNKQKQSFKPNLVHGKPNESNTQSKTPRHEKHKNIEQNEGETINLPEGYDINSHPDHTDSPLAAYCFYPDKVEYVNLDAQERTILLLRKHFVTNIPWMTLTFFMIIFPSFFPLLPFYDSFPGAYQLIATLSWYLIVIAVALEKFLSWFFNVDLITDERIMDIHFVSLMYREVTEANLDEIQEVTVRPATGIYSFFHFGTVMIQTAAERPRLEFLNVPKPEKVAKILRELMIQEEIEKIEGRVR